MSMVFRSIVCCALISATACFGGARDEAAPRAGLRPKLVLVISVDQFSADLFQRYGKDLPGGLGLLQKQGVVFTEAYHDHAFTETGPGHSVLLSGRFPGHTGIVENSWYDRALGRAVYCVADENVQAVGRSKKAGVSQSRFIGTTLGDWLQAQVTGSRAYSLSGKDRAAVLMAGRKPTAVFWFEGAAGFNTSTAYAEKQPQWLTSLDESLHQRFLRDNWTWTALASWSGAARTGAWTLPGGQVVRNGLPRVVQGLGMPLDKDFSERFRRSPFFDQVTLEAARVLVEQEQVGRGPSTDLFTLSLSATDYIGHNFGSGSVEMWDQIHRLDQELGKFLAWLQKRVPDTWVVLSADHGGMDLPEGLKEDGLPAERLSEPKDWFAQLNIALRRRLKVEVDLVRASNVPTQIYLDDSAIKTIGLDREKVLEAIQAQLKTQPEVEASVTALTLEAFKEPALGNPRDSSLMARFNHSFMVGRSGDVMVAFKPLTIFSDPPYVTNHGSPWDYDRRVPIIFMGPWKPQTRRQPVRTVDLAPTLALELGIKPAEPLDGKALDLGARRKK
ncbi:MAG: alkaline phosphatase family protein [Holophagaceae bacterium]|nr:alkaline phosphatase family protein [Holophagaceae bacterium]